MQCSPQPDPPSVDMHFLMPGWCVVPPPTRTILQMEQHSTQVKYFVVASCPQSHLLKTFVCDTWFLFLGCQRPDPQDLLRQLLTKEPSNRIKMDGLKVHPWVTCNGTLQPLQSSTDRSLERVYVMLQHKSGCLDFSRCMCLFKESSGSKTALLSSCQNICSVVKHHLTQ